LKIVLNAEALLKLFPLSGFSMRNPRIELPPRISHPLQVDSDRKFRLVMIGMAFVSTIAVVFIASQLSIRPSAAPVPAFPSPNGYLTFLEAGEQLEGDASDYKTLPIEDLRELVEMNTNALRLVRKGLQQDSRVPLEFSKAYITNHLSGLAKVKRLGLILAAAGSLAELEGDYENAARSYVQVVQLGVNSTHGGVIINALVGWNVESIGTRHLNGLVPHLDAPTSRGVLEELERLDAKRESWESVMRAEKDWARQTFIFYERALNVVISRSTKEAERKGENRYNQQTLKARSLLLDHAARTYKLEKGLPPKDASDLVPGYLKSVPKDPFTGKYLSLRP
jgi:hypothetical protein